MSRIYEALEYAGLAPVEEPATEIEFKVSLPPVVSAFESKLLSLYSRIEGMLDNRTGKVISFAGMNDSEASATYVMEMARTGAVRLGKRVLVLATFGSACGKKLTDSGLAKGWEGIAYSAKSINEAIYRINEPPMSISQLNTSKESLSTLLSSMRFMNTMRLMRKRYDWIFIDTPPLGQSPDASLVSPVSDGTVVVVDAGGVRWQVVRNAVEQISGQRGNVLGVVLNNRKFIIPDFIYRKL